MRPTRHTRCKASRELNGRGGQRRGCHEVGPLRFGILGQPLWIGILAWPPIDVGFILGCGSKLSQDMDRRLLSKFPCIRATHFGYICFQPRPYSYEGAPRRGSCSWSWLGFEKPIARARARLDHDGSRGLRIGDQFEVLEHPPSWVDMKTSSKHPHKNQGLSRNYPQVQG